MKLWLDDVRDPAKFGCIGYVWVKTADEAIAALKAGEVEIASLDHDLSEEHYPWNCSELPASGAKTGYDVILFLEANPQFWPPRGCRVHSANPAGAVRMRQVIERHYQRSL